MPNRKKLNRPAACANHGEGATIPSAFFYSKTAARDSPSLIVRDGDGIIGKPRAAFEKEVRELAFGLIGIGVSPGDRVAILLENGPEWIISDLAISASGAVSVPVYTTLGMEEKAFVLRDAGVSAMIFSAPFEAAAVSMKKGLESLKSLISTARAAGVGVMTFEGLKRLGAGPPGCTGEKTLDERMGAIGADDPFSIIYSSGTTGRPKGVILTHKNILSNITAVSEVIPLTREDVYLSYLPLSHVFERMMHHLLIFNGIPIAYSRGFAHAAADARFFRPTFMTGVPFFFERMKERILSAVAGIEETGSAGWPSGTPNWPSALKKIKEDFAPGLKFFISGGAALNAEIVEFFGRLGLPVLQGYGLTETSAVVTVNTLDDNRAGTVGRPVKGVRVKIGEDGEILVKGPNVMKGYLNMPDATLSANEPPRSKLRGIMEHRSKQLKACLEESNPHCGNEDGWFHTGDIGFIDRDGFLTITGRKKDIIVTSLGKNVSPQKIEALLKSDECVKEAMVYGDGKPHLVALIVPATEKMEAFLKKHVTNGRHSVLDGQPAPLRGQLGVLDNETARDFFGERIRARLKGLARFEQVRNFALIADTLSCEGGELTPTMKVKRRKVAEKYKALIDSLYDGRHSVLDGRQAGPE